jgi:hypothetical protein
MLLITSAETLPQARTTFEVRLDAFAASFPFPNHLHTALLARVKSVQGEINTLTTGNATLQMYIDNLTVQMAKRR